MYVTEVKKINKGKTYKSVLIRESYRENGEVKNRTVSNITHLSPELIEHIKLFFKDEGRDFNLDDLENGNTYEYGASQCLKKFAQQIGLEKMIFSKKTEWRENVMAMIIGRILYQGSKLSLVNTFRDTALWEISGHKYGERPNVEKHCYKPMDELIKRKNKIQKKLAKKHLNNGCILLYDITNTWFEGDYEDSNIVKFGKGKGGKVGFKQISIGLITNHEGCPIAVEIFKGNTSDQKTVLAQIKKVKDKYGIKDAIMVGDRGMLTRKRVEEIKETDYKIITALTHCEMQALIEKEDLQKDLFDEKNITEVIDSETGTRYALCKNEQEMLKERKTRKSLIERVIQELTKKASAKRKRNRDKVCASIGRIFQKYKIEKFFNWQVDDNGRVTWSLNEEKIAAEEELDGCYVIKTTVSKKKMDTEEFVGGYKSLQKVEQGFKNMKTVLLELRPIYHHNDERIEAHVFIVMLAYYLQWHAMQKLKPLFDEDGKGKEKRWTFKAIIERLKSIRKVENLINGIVVKTNISKPDDEQKKILDLLEVKIM